MEGDPMRSIEWAECVMRKRAEWVVVSLIVLLGTAVTPAASLAQEVAATDGTGLISDAPVFPAVDPPSRYENAIESGTRSTDGRHGGDYWQQRADYRIAVGRDIGMNSVVLSELTMLGGILAPAFDPQITAYTTSVGADVDVIQVSATPLDASVGVFVGDYRYVAQPAIIDILLYEGVTVPEQTAVINLQGFVDLVKSDGGQGAQPWP